MKNKTSWLAWGGVIVTLVLGTSLRFAYLGLADTKADEMNQVRYVLTDISLTEHWANPPWFNQIPTVDSLPVVWARMMPWRKRLLADGTPDMRLVREPFALLGCLGILFIMVWTGRRRGWAAAILAGAWAAVLPFHLFHSREAYYYAPLLLLGAGLLLRTLDFTARLMAGQTLRWQNYAEWFAWAWAASMCHMSVWVLAAGTWLTLTLVGWARLKGPRQRRRHRAWTGVVALLLLLAMSRWIGRGVYEFSRISTAESAYPGIINTPLSHVLTWLLPVFCGGRNWIGCGLLAAVLAMAAGVWYRQKRRPDAGTDGLYTLMSFFAWGALGLVALYVFGVSGGSVGKHTYFTACLPLWLVWMASTADRFWHLHGPRGHRWGMVGSTVIVVGLLLWPAWMVTQLEGVPTSYRELRTWLDDNLAAGDAAVVDRWSEPWNEMKLYAPDKVFVTFTVPDEPYAAYQDNNWRSVTRQFIEQNGAQAFIRLTRNHADRVGVWTWPETWFRHRAVITNEPGIWLRDTGFAPLEDFYNSPSRLEVEVFYSTHDELAADAARRGDDAIHFFGAGWRVVKPFLTGDWNSYHMMAQNGAQSEVYNLCDKPIQMSCEITGTAMDAPAHITINDTVQLNFQGGRIERQKFTLLLQPGRSALAWTFQGTPGALLVQELQFSYQE